MNALQTTTAFPEVLTGGDLASENFSPSDHDVLSFIDASKCVVKIVDVANNASFNALSIGHDFQVSTAQIKTFIFLYALFSNTRNIS